LPRLVIRSVEPQSEVAKAGLKSGDMLLAVNDQPVYNLEDYQAFFLTARTLRVTYQRHYKEYQTTVNFPERRSVTVTEVIPGSNAEKAELQKGDTILQVERSDVASPEEVIVRLAAAKNAGKPAQLLVERGKSLFTAYVSAGADGTYGLQVSPIINQNLGVVLVATSSPTSVLELKPVSYGFFSSIRMAFTETGRLAKATLAMFGNLFSKLFSSLEVPEGVSGPVGIAQMTGIFVKEGFLSLLRFMALLSLSLGVLNLLPFPGLDGGRLLFILIEGVLGRPVNRKIEQLVHAFGAILLILIIAVVTYKDIVRIL
jgi:regulator of sigma E protease